MIGLGTDSAASNNSLDLFTQMRNVALLQKHKEYDALQCSAQEVLDMATINDARVSGLEDKIGSVEVGKQADFTFLNSNDYNLQPLSKERIISHLVYSANAGNVTDTMVAGEFIKLDKDHINELVKEAVYELGV